MSRLAACGTRAAYERHRRDQEPVDAACREANRAYHRRHYAGVIAAEALERTMRQEALEALAHQHRDEFGRLLARVQAETLGGVR